MSAIFVDTSAWVALYNPDDQYHRKAKHFLAPFRSPRDILITTDYIMDETLTMLLVRVGFPVAPRCGTDILEKKLPTIIPVGMDRLLAAWGIFKKFNRDKKWSLTDCTSYIVMKEEGWNQVFTFDRTDFSQMGFHIVP